MRQKINYPELAAAASVDMIGFVGVSCWLWFEEKRARRVCPSSQRRSVTVTADQSHL